MPAAVAAAFAGAGASGRAPGEEADKAAHRSQVAKDVIVATVIVPLPGCLADCCHRIIWSYATVVTAFRLKLDLTDSHALVSYCLNPRCCPMTCRDIVSPDAMLQIDDCSRRRFCS